LSQTVRVRKNGAKRGASRFSVQSPLKSGFDMRLFLREMNAPDGRAAKSSIGAEIANAQRSYRYTSLRFPIFTTVTISSPETTA
jgi:hypothetical protein